MSDNSPVLIAQVICRTCNQNIKCAFHALDEVQPYENHSITLADLLLDVARIDTKTEASENELPKHLCDKCTSKLKSAYDFVLQAREVNEQLLGEFFKKSKLKDALSKTRAQDCLLEEEVEVPIFDNNELVQVKLEVDCGDFLNSSEHNDEEEEQPMQDDTIFESKFIEKDDESKVLEDVEDPDKQLKNDPLVNNSDIVIKDESEDSDAQNEASPILESNYNHGGYSESESEPLTKRTRSAVKAASRKLYDRRDEDDCYVCSTCDESFCSQKDLNRHMSKHKGLTHYECTRCDRTFNRKTDYKSHKCASSSSRKRSNDVSKRGHASRVQKTDIQISFKAIQCALCETKTENLKELRDHLEEHKDGSTGVVMNEKSRYFKTHYPNGCEGREPEITARIAADFLKRDLTAYYSALDESANELDIDDSETEFEEFLPDAVEPVVKKEVTRRFYVCDICGESFDRVKKIQEHQENKHSEDTESLSQCDACQERFVSVILLERHQRNMCKNEHKVHQCSKCPLKFVWPENLQSHYESKHEDHGPGENQCEACGKIFPWMKDLRRHREMHVTEGQKIKCHLCPRKFLRSDQLKHHLERYDHSRDDVAEDRTEIERSSTDKLQCQVCGKKIAYAKNLARHMQMHADKPERYQCHICTFKFNRKDNLYAHLKLHGDEAFVESWKEDLKNASKHPKSKGVIDNQCKPNGNKCIQCMICLALHSTIADLRKHIREHQYVVTWGDRKESIEKISAIFYPGEKRPVTQEKALIHRIQNDIKAHRLDRFYSITNEFGLELNIDSSETETEVNDSSDEDDDDDDGDFGGRGKIKRIQKAKKYSCDLCDMTFNRKYKVFEHQNNKHDWEAAPHYCTLCNSRFLNRRMLERHWEKFCHNKRKRFICRKCPMRFMWKANLSNHTRLSHMPKIEKAPLLICRFECDECGRKYLMKKDLTRHMLTHKAKTPLMKCLFCPMSFFKKEYFDGHIRQHGIEVNDIPIAESILRATRLRSGTKDIKCQNCNTTFKTISALRVHLQLEVMSGMTASHIYNSSLNYSITNALGFEMTLDDSETEGEDENGAPSEGMPSMDLNASLVEYTCEICNLAFKRKYEIAQHQSSAHSYESLPLKCEKCIFKTVNRRILDYHKKTQCENVEKQFQCEKCSFKYMWPENLEKHKQLMHAGDLVSGSDGSANNPKQGDALNDIVIFQCDQCPSKYCSKERLVRHIKSCHAIKSEARNADDDPSGSGQNSSTTKRKQFLCSFCGCALASASNLTIHMRKHTGEKPFKCDFCEMAFPKCSDMRVHRRVHTGEKPYPCQICGKAFSRSYKLKLHMRVHSGEKPYKCNQCDKRFTQSSELTLHIRRHTGEKPYICNICGLRFVQGTALRRHQKKRNHAQLAQAMADAMSQQVPTDSGPTTNPPIVNMDPTATTTATTVNATITPIAEEF